MGAVVAAVEALFEGAWGERQAGCGLGEAVGEILSESLVVGDAGEAVAGVAGNRERGAPRLAARI